jgi:thiol-disulfide isomerase/thioredoxin
MDLGRWVLLVVVVAAAAFGGWRALSDGRFRGTRRLRGGSGLEAGTDVPPRPAGPSREAEPVGSANLSASLSASPSASLLAGTAYDDSRGERATLLQFSSAFCAPCRATRRTLADVAATVPGVVHVEVDAEEHLDLVRRLGILRTPTTLVLDAAGSEVTRATGAPRAAQVLAALEGGLA